MCCACVSGEREAATEMRWVRVDYLALPLRRQGLGIKIVDLVKAWIIKQNSYSFITLYARSVLGKMRIHGQR